MSLADDDLDPGPAGTSSTRCSSRTSVSCHWQMTIWILVLPVPVQQGVRRERVSHVMETRPVTVGFTAQTDLTRQLVERAVDLSAVELIAPV